MKGFGERPDLLLMFRVLMKKSQQKQTEMKRDYILLKRKRAVHSLLEVHYFRWGNKKKKRQKNFLYRSRFVCLHFILFVCQLDSFSPVLSSPLFVFRFLSLTLLSVWFPKDFCFSIARQSAISVGTLTRLKLLRYFVLLLNSCVSSPSFFALFNFSLSLDTWVENFLSVPLE